MSRRKKTQLEKWFSLSRHKRRAGAKNLGDSISTDFKAQKNTLIAGDSIEYTHGSNNDIETHFNELEKEFINQSQLCFTHAKIIVLIRREFKISTYYPLFETLWAKEKKHLLKNLNTRWLIAAADTFADHSKDKSIQASAVACSCLINTLKIQETERYITNTLNTQDDAEKINHLKNENRIALFDGTSALAVGTDDTLRNMRWRIDKIAKENVTGEILLELFKRLHEHDTVYQRFKKRHHRNRTAWW